MRLSCRLRCSTRREARGAMRRRRSCGRTVHPFRGCTARENSGRSTAICIRAPEISANAWRSVVSRVATRRRKRPGRNAKSDRQLLVTNSCCGRALPANSKCMTPQLVAGLSPSRRAQSNRSCIGDRVWILPDWPRPCRTSANTASRPDTEFHGVRYGVPRSRHYRASRRNHSTAQ